MYLTDMNEVLHLSYWQPLTSIIWLVDELFQKAVLVKVDVPKPELHLFLHITQQLFDTGPLLLLYLLVLTAGFCSTSIQSSPRCVNHPVGETATQTGNRHTVIRSLNCFYLYYWSLKRSSSVFIFGKDVSVHIQSRFVDWVKLVELLNCLSKSQLLLISSLKSLHLRCRIHKLMVI